MSIVLLFTLLSLLCVTASIVDSAGGDIGVVGVVVGVGVASYINVAVIVFLWISLLLLFMLLLLLHAFVMVCDYVDYMSSVIMVMLRVLFGVRMMFVMLVFRVLLLLLQCALTLVLVYLRSVAACCVALLPCCQC